MMSEIYVILMLAKKKYKCTPCSRSFHVRFNLDRHLKSHEHKLKAGTARPKISKDPVVAARRAATRTAGTYQCTVCNYTAGRNCGKPTEIAFLFMDVVSKIPYKL